MRRLFFRVFQFGLMGLVLGGCLFDGLGGGVTVPPDPKNDEPYIRALLDSNGLQAVPLYEVMKLLDPQGRHPEYYISLGSHGLREFRFTADVSKIKAVQTISLVSNEITKVPQGIHYKKWKGLWLDRNKLCGLSQQDSTDLEIAGALWKGNQNCPIP